METIMIFRAVKELCHRKKKWFCWYIWTIGHVLIHWKMWWQVWLELYNQPKFGFTEIPASDGWILLGMWRRYSRIITHSVQMLYATVSARRQFSAAVPSVCIGAHSISKKAPSSLHVLSGHSEGHHWRPWRWATEEAMLCCCYAPWSSLVLPT